MKNENRIVARILGNCSVYSKLPKMDNAKVMRLPPSCTSLLKPLDQSAMYSIKAHCQTQMLETILLNIARMMDICQVIEMLSGA